MSERDIIGVSVALHTTNFRGDHSADVVLIIDCDEETTIGDLMRTAMQRRGAHHPVEHDYIVLRPIVREAAE